MRKKTLREILEACQKSGSLDELLNALNNNDYVEDTAGKVVKITFFRTAKRKKEFSNVRFCYGKKDGGHDQSPLRRSNPKG